MVNDYAWKRESRRRLVLVRLFDGARLATVTHESYGWHVEGIGAGPACPSGRRLALSIADKARKKDARRAALQWARDTGRLTINGEWPRDEHGRELWQGYDAPEAHECEECSVCGALLSPCTYGETDMPALHCYRCGHVYV